MKSETYGKLDKAIYKCFISVRHSNIPISATIIKLKALECAKVLQCNNIQTSDEWLDRWKERFNVCFKTLSGAIYKFFNSGSFRIKTACLALSFLFHLIDLLLLQSLLKNIYFSRLLLKSKNSLGKSSCFPFG